MTTRCLASLLGATILAALLSRHPLFGVPAYEAGVAVGLLAAVLSYWLALARARRRPTTAAVSWGVLRVTPGEQVLDEIRPAAWTALGLVGIPLALLATEALTTGCRILPGLAPFLLVAAPAPIVGTAFGSLVGSISRRRLHAAALSALLGAASVALPAAEGFVGPRHALHSVVLGPLTTNAYMGYDSGLSFPASATRHRLFALALSAVVLVGAALVRTRVDRPAATGSAGPADAGGDGGWAASRSGDDERARFLLQHHRRGLAKLLLLASLVLLPFLAGSDACGLTSGRRALARALPGVLETEHVRIHYAPGTAVEGDLPRLAVEHETAWRQLTRWLGTRPDWKVDSWIHPDEESLFERTGARGYVFAAPWNREMHVHFGEGEVGSLRHEMAHVLAADFGGWPLRTSWCPGLIEGLATALDEGHARATGAHEQVAAAARAGHVPRATELMSLTGFAAGNMDRAYRSSASFVGFLMLRHGPAALRQAHPRGDFEGAYGMGLAALDDQWRDFLESEVEVGASVAARARERFDPARRPAFHSSPCPRVGRRAERDPAAEARLLGSAQRDSEAADLYCEAWDLTADVAHLEAAASHRARSGDLEGALRLIERALSVGVPETRRDDALRRRSHLLVRLGRWADAATAIEARRAAGLATWPERIELDAQALADPEIRERYFEARDVPAGAARLAGALAAEHPGSPAVLELLLQAESARRPAAADLPFLAATARRFAELSPDTPMLAARHLALVARTAERLGDWPLAEALHRQVLEMPALRFDERLAAEDGVERAGVAAALRIPPGPPRDGKDARPLNPGAAPAEE